VIYLAPPAPAAYGREITFAGGRTACCGNERRSSSGCRSCVPRSGKWSFPNARTYGSSTW